MTADSMNYGAMMEDAMRSVVRRALAEAAENGMPGEHHFYVTFRTTADGVDIPEFLLAQFPEEMTIVLQHQYWDLEVSEDRFTVMLSFNNNPAQLNIPFSAVAGFVDPSVKFGLQFGGTAPDPAVAPEHSQRGETPAKLTAVDLTGDASTLEYGKGGSMRRHGTENDAGGTNPALAVEPADREPADREPPAMEPAAPEEEAELDLQDPAKPHSADVVTLDQFRKKT
jgi:hypothetical protein